MNTGKVILATLVIFLAGIVTGGVMVGFGMRTKERIVRQYEKGEKNRPGQGREFSNQGGNSAARDPQRPLNPPNRQILNREFLEKLHTELELTTGQRERIADIVTDGQQRNREIMERVTPDLRREMQETQKKIRDLLNGPQLVKFDELMKSRQPRREEPGPNMRQRENRRQPGVQAMPEETSERKKN